MEKVFAAAANGAKPEDIRPDLEEFLRAEHAWLSEEQRALVGKTPDEFIKRIADEHLKDVTSPMFRSLIGYNATETLAKTRCPALMLFAGRDRKVDPSKSREMAKTAPRKPVERIGPSRSSRARIISSECRTQSPRNLARSKGSHGNSLTCL